MAADPAAILRVAMRTLMILLAGCALAGAIRAEPFEFDRDCAKWIERKGYSIDYIEQKTGQRQPGWSENWRSNVDVSQIQPGDVAIYLVPDKGKSSRVAYVEAVRRNPDGGPATVVVSEWNLGKYIDERCMISDHFGRLSLSKPMDIDMIVKVWRPSLPLPPRPARVP
jgi:hypothetical protein